MAEIIYLKGDATEPQGDGAKLVIHIVNDLGKFGAGFAKNVLDKYPIVRDEYMSLFNKVPGKVFLSVELGDVQFVKVSDELYFANMFGQRGIISKSNPVPLQYDALEECLKKVYNYTLTNKVSLFGPRFGVGFGGAKWPKIEKTIKKQLLDKDVGITIYDL